MKSNDIQVGDYIYGVLGAMRVVSIGKSTVTGQWADMDNPEVIHETNCIYEVAHPIPITKELLQLKGIKKTYESRLHKTWDIDFGDVYDITLRYSIDNKTWLVSAMSLKECIQIKKYIKYVHQLQHILGFLGLSLSETLKFE